MKAILVLEMPSKCEECNFHQYGICHAVRKCIVGTPTDLKSKPDWCPLKPMPDKQPTEMKTINDDINKLVFNDGYNACIDEILGDKE